MKKTFLLLTTIFILSGCASRYYPISNSQSYRNTEEGNNLTYSYKFDVLAANGNKKYAKKEAKHNIDVMSVKITNNTDRELSVDNDIDFYVSNRQVQPLESTSVTSRIKQGAAIYLLYSFLFLYVDDGSSRTTIPIGVGIGIGNMAFASANNKKFKDEFSINNIIGKTIKPGETLHGLVGFIDIEHGSLRMEVKE